MSSNLFDVHAHVQFSDFDGDREEVIKEALSSSVWLINVGTDKGTSEKAAALARTYAEGVYATVGLHPNDCEKGFDEKFFKKLAGDSSVVAIGETGLDYFRLPQANREAVVEKQKEVFIKHIKLAGETGKPLMIHCRDAFADLAEILKLNTQNLKPGVLHFFTGTLDDASKFLKMDFYFSFGGVVTFARDYDAVIKFLPLGRILLETDAPYVSPEPLRGCRNEPKNVALVAEKIAEIKGLSYDEVAEATTDNARSLFGV